jgi:hypothetical protein
MTILVLIIAGIAIYLWIVFAPSRRSSSREETPVRRLEHDRTGKGDREEPR